MPKIKDNIIRMFNRIFRRNNIPMIANVTKQNYDEYRKTYDTLLEIFSKTDGMDLFLIGGISAAIQTNIDLYRQNSDIDIMCREEQLQFLIETLQKAGYCVDDRRGIKTRNTVDIDGQFHTMDHELNADTKSKKLLGVGIFTYSVQGNKVITHSYSYHEKEGRVIGIEKLMQKELFDLIYDNNVVYYKGIKLKTQSKESLYLTKSKGKREKDKIDASVIEPTLNEESRKKIVKIRELEAKTSEYKLLFDENGGIESRSEVPSFADRFYSFLNLLYKNNPAKTPQQIIDDVLQSEQYRNRINQHPEIDLLIQEWLNMTTSYAHKGEKKSIPDNSLEYLQDFN